MSESRHREIPPSEKEIFGDHKFSEIELGMLQMQILWILDHKPTHGYELMKILSELKRTKITQGTLYPTLQILEARGYIKRNEEDRRTVYNTTSKGRKVMNDTCVDFSKTFFGIFQNFVCHKCLGHDKLIDIGEKK